MTSSPKLANTKNTPVINMSQPKSETHGPLSQELQTAIDAAYAGAQKVLHYYHEGIKAELKADKTVLTAADLESEAVIIATIRQSFPEASFLAEESGGDKRESTMWI